MFGTVEEMETNIFSFLMNFFNIIVDLGVKLWHFLTTPFAELFAELPEWIGDILGTLFNDLIGEYTIIDAFVVFVIAFLLIKLYHMIFG